MGRYSYAILTLIRSSQGKNQVGVRNSERFVLVLFQLGTNFVVVLLADFSANGAAPIVNRCKYEQVRNNRPVIIRETCSDRADDKLRGYSSVKIPFPSSAALCAANPPLLKSQPAQGREAKEHLSAIGTIRLQPCAP